jgi:hypothetical protein
MLVRNDCHLMSSFAVHECHDEKKPRLGNNGDAVK